MPRIFINFRSQEQIFDCMLYSKELGPIVLDEGKYVVKLFFLADMFDNELINVHIHGNDKIKQSSASCVMVGNPSGNCETLFHENILQGSTPTVRSNLSSINTAPNIDTPDGTLRLCVIPSYKCVVLMDAHLASCCAIQIRRSRTFRRRFLKYLARKFGFKVCDYENIDYARVPCEDFLSIPYMVDVVAIWPKRQTLDYYGSSYFGELVVKRMFLEEAMAWLSTLGGGYSALGDYNPAFALTAGQVSLKQMKIATELGDPIMAAKCRLFWALSLLQLGYFKECKRIVRRQFKCAYKLDVLDVRLVNMCLAIWNRLRYVRTLARNGSSIGKECYIHKIPAQNGTVEIHQNTITTSS